MFQVKICGVRRNCDVQWVSQAGGDAIGLNFFPKSVRYVDPKDESTAELCQLANEFGLLRVGVFVNRSAVQCQEVAEAVGLDVIQLHGDESVDVAQQLTASGCRVVRAIKLPLGEIGAQAINDLVSPWLDAGCHLLFDADAGAAHGGSGKTLHWQSLAAWQESDGCSDWTLAGGLKPENIAAAIRASGATSIDTASGVECPRGVKSEERVQQFCRSALAAWASQS